MKQPLLYEIDTRCWLHDLSQKAGKAITLANVPDAEFENWRRLGFTHVWLMGVWEIGSRGREFCRSVPELREAGAALLPDFRVEDIAGSPYAIAGYQVSPALGGEGGLARFRSQLAAHGLKLILDFIPNHTGLDHAWLEEHPELFVQSPDDAPETFEQATRRGSRRLAHGKDPHFPAWIDTAQLDYRNAATHAAMAGELKRVAGLCDGVRCDMAMLVLKDVFAKTWARFPTANLPPATEFWAAVIPVINARHPDFLFLAEAYWDLEERLIGLGFDYAYDKRVCDHLIAWNPAALQRHLHSRTPQVIQASAHFLENHDEPRIASLLSFPEHRAAAVLILALPGLRLLHEGQLAGATRRASVHFGRRPPEPVQPEISDFYESLLITIQSTSIGRGQGRLLQPLPASAHNPTAGNCVGIHWQSTPGQFDLILVNLSSHPSQGCVRLEMEGGSEQNWRWVDLLAQGCDDLTGAVWQDPRLYFDLPGHGTQLLHFWSDGAR